MTEYILLIVSNLIFQSSRTWNTRAIAKEDTLKVVLSSVVVKISWIISSAIAINSILEGDFLLTSTYIITGVLGDYIGMKIKQ